MKTGTPNQNDTPQTGDNNQSQQKEVDQTMTMRYIRIVIAVTSEDEEDTRLNLDSFIEEELGIQGAYVSGSYDTRDEAVHYPTWKDPNP